MAQQSDVACSSSGGCGLFRQHSNSSTSCSSSDSEYQPNFLQLTPGSMPDDRRLKEHVEKALKTKSAVSLLQEFVQYSMDFRLPPREPILRWHYETRVRGNSTLEFKSRALFLIGGALHHAVGTWQLSKKLAQRDAAERAIGFFLGNWCDLLLATNAAELDAEDQQVASTYGKSTVACVQEMHALEKYSKHFQGNDLSTRHEIHDDGQWQALIEMNISGVPHRFSGPKCADKEEACKQAARRVLWYLQHPDYVDAFEPDVDAIPAAMSAPPPCWSCDQTSDESQAAQRKTTIMRIQNRLQQRLGQTLKQGKSVWEWNYESDGKGWPPFVRASVRLAIYDRTFTGNWVRSHRGAQLDTCALVEQFLNQLDKEL